MVEKKYLFVFKKRNTYLTFRKLFSIRNKKMKNKNTIKSKNSKIGFNTQIRLTSLVGNLLNYINQFNLI